MIAVDTSALIAIVLGEPEAQPCIQALGQEPDIIISAATLTEALIVAARRGQATALDRLMAALNLRVIPYTEAAARRASQAYETWGKGIHPASLNLGDCFAYEVAQHHNCPLLFLGNDFSKTDIQTALPPTP